MSDGAAQTGGAQAAPAGEASAVATTAATAAAAAPAAAQAPAAPVAPTAPNMPAPPAAVPSPAVAVVPAVAAQAAPAPAPADCVPAKKKVVHTHDKKETEEEHARLADSDEDQNLSQPADGCVLPQTGDAAAPAPQDGGAVVVDDSDGGGISPLLIGAGVLAAIGIAVAAGSGGGDDDDDTPPVTPPANGIPVAVADTGAVNEGSTLTGSVATNDSDPNNDPLTYATTGTVPAGLTLNANGSYTFDANNAAYNSLAAGQTQVVVANYTVSDGRGGTATSTLTITVTGTNDAPVAVADTGPASTEGGTAVTGSVATNDSDPDQNSTLTYTLNAPVAGLTLNSNGSYTFNPADPAYNSLAAGQTQTIVANYTVRDAAGLTSTSTLTLVITGTNDVPVVGNDTAVVNEGAVVTGNLAANDSDPDAGQTATLTYTLAAPVAGLTVNPNGTFSFDANNAAYNSLAAGQTQTVVANVTVTDASGGTSTSTLTITVTGTNDVPVAVADVAAATEGGPVVTGNLAANDSDPDAGQTATLTYTLAQPVAGLTVNSNGTFSFDPSNPAYNGLAAGQTQNVVANVTVTDASGGTSTSTLTITVTGTNDAPTAVADLATVTEDGSVSGNLRTNDIDPDANAALTYTVVGTPPAGFTLNADGTYTFNAAANPAYQALGAGQNQTVTVNYQVSDGTATSTSTLTITVTGVNDAPVAVNDTNTAIEGGTVVTGNLRTNDSDVDTPVANLTYALASPVAGLTVNANGTYSFDPTNAAYNALAAGQTQVVNATINVSDGQGGTTTSTLAITVTGTNDAPTAVNDTATATENGPVVTGNLRANDSDVDTPVANLTYSLAAPVAGLTVNPDGTFSFDPSNPAYDAILGGQTQVVNATINVSDGQGGTTTSTLAITVTGVTETVNLDIDNDANLNTARVFEAASGDFAFTDDDDVANLVIINGFGADDYITFEAPFSGAGSASFANIDFDGDGLANDLRITTNKGGVVSDIVIRNVVDPNLVIFNEATADAAVAGADNFRTTAQTVVPVQQSLDVDGDSNLATRYTLPVAANTASFAFSDSISVANNVLVRDFGGDDVITFNGASSQYSFASGDFDADGVADDLRITSNVGGTVSDIVLTNSVQADAVIFDEAGAEAAIGAGVENFVFNGTVTPPPPPPPVGNTTVSLDVDSDANLNTRQQFDAGADGFRYTDNISVANSVDINNFGTNDLIVFSGATSVSYGNGAFDSDGIANDLRITINNGGVVSDIIIKNVLTDTNAVVFDEATANAALNSSLGSTGVDYFQFA